MTSEALGVSVAPSFFHSCVSDGKTAKMEDVMKFKVSVDFNIIYGIYFKWKLSTYDFILTNIYYTLLVFPYPKLFPRRNDGSYKTIQL